MDPKVKLKSLIDRMTNQPPRSPEEKAVVQEKLKKLAAAVGHFYDMEDEKATAEYVSMVKTEIGSGKLVYLAAPYSSKDHKITEQRIEQFCQLDAMLIKEGIITVSPLSKHFILHYQDLPGNWTFWGGYSERLLKACDAMLIILIDGWDESEGVKAEIDLAFSLKIPIYFIEPNGRGFDQIIAI